MTQDHTLQQYVMEQHDAKQDDMIYTLIPLPRVLCHLITCYAHDTPAYHAYMHNMAIFDAWQHQQHTSA